MDERQKLTVPDLVGQPVHIAQEIAANIGLVSQPGTLTGRGSVRVRGPGCSGRRPKIRPPGRSLGREAKLGLLSFRTVKPEATCRSRRAGRPPHLRLMRRLRKTSERNGSTTLGGNNE